LNNCSASKIVQDCWSYLKLNLGPVFDAQHTVTVMCSWRTQTAVN